jgi:predicted ribosome quality control (RQC) complex YloA/Tae2 family protein
LRLKNEYLQKQQNIVQYNTDVVTFGEMRLLQELKLANDNLRWRMEQKNLLLTKNRDIIQNLSNQCKQLEEKNKELEKKNSLLTSQLQQPPQAGKNGVVDHRHEVNGLSNHIAVTTSHNNNSNTTGTVQISSNSEPEDQKVKVFFIV